MRRALLLGISVLCACFEQKRDLPNGRRAHAVAIADVNGDGRLDLVSAGDCGGTTGECVAVHLATSGGAFLPMVVCPRVVVQRGAVERRRGRRRERADGRRHLGADRRAARRHRHVPDRQALTRTTIFVKGLTQPGQDMFVRGGIDHGYASRELGRSCTAQNFLCAIPIRHRNPRNATTVPWKANDSFLDWYGTEPGQSTQAQGTAADWTTNRWTFGAPLRTVAVDGFGEEPLNAWGDHYWMVDVHMDCTKAVQGVWFELKTFITNGPGWEPDTRQAGAP